MVERFSGKVTKALYRNRFDPVGLATDNERFNLTKFLAQDYEEVERKLQSPDQCMSRLLTISGVQSLNCPTGTIWASERLSAAVLRFQANVAALNIANALVVSFLYLRAVGLHLRLSILFASPSSQDYNDGLFSLWQAATAFLERALKLESPPGSPAGNLLAYSSNYVLQMITASGFTLLKLLNSFFASFIDLEYGRKLFTETIRAIRAISVTKHDLPSRLAEVLAQLWKGSGAGSRHPIPTSHAMEKPLQLKVKCRMSMSLVFDSVWRWREEFQAQGRGNLEGKAALS